MEEKDRIQDFMDSAKEMAEKAAEQMDKAKDEAAEKFGQFSEAAAEKLAQFGDAAGQKLGQIKEAAGEKLTEWSDKAEKMAAEAQVEAAQKAAELKAAKEKIAAHEGGALGFLTDKANELLGNVQEGAAGVTERGKDFWEKAKDFVADKNKEENAEEGGDTKATD